MPLEFRTLAKRVAHLEQLAAGNPRGRALEQLVGELFETLPGVDIADRNVLAGSGEAELDLLLSNSQREDGLPAFGRDFLVECKSSDDPLDCRGINHFISQVARRHLRWSVIVSLAGVTGNREELTRAQHEIARAAEAQTWVMVIVKRELKQIRSAEHFAAVIEQKRRKQVGKMHAVILSDDELAELDPNRGRVDFIRGAAGIEQAIRAAHDDAVGLILDAAVELPVLNDEFELIARAAESLAALDRELADHRENPDDDPMWRRVHDELIEVGAAFACLLDEDPKDPDARRRLAFDVRVSAPQKLDAFVGGTLWNLLSKYRLAEVRSDSAHTRRQNATAMVAMVVEQMISIDDIDPRDVYDDLGYDEP